MNVLIAIAAGLLGGATSAFLTGALTAGICAALNVRDRDGGVGYLVMFVGLFGGIIGLIASIILTLRWRGQTASAVFAQTPMALAGIIAIGALVILFVYYSKDHPIIDGAPPVLDFQVQSPAGAPPFDPKTMKIRLQTGDKYFDDPWFDDDGQTGHLQLNMRISMRLLDIDFGNNSNQVFRLKLPASPMAKRYQRWSDWYAADFGFTPDSRTSQSVDPAKSYRIRYMVEPYVH